MRANLIPEFGKKTTDLGGKAAFSCSLMNLPAHLNQPLAVGARALHRGQVEPNVPTISVPQKARGNSSVTAGWICIGLGLLTAWFYPLGHVFFSVAIILSIIALATHQIGQGLALLISGLIGMTICVAVFVTLFLGAVQSRLKAIVPPALPPIPVASALRGVVSNPPPQLPSVHAPTVLSVPAPAISAPPIPTAAPALPFADPAAKQRRIDDLKRQIDSLDDEVRNLRAGSSRGPYFYGTGSNQQARDLYLNQLDERRNVLRREKWRLEGR